MTSDKMIIQHLNTVLRNELTGINQYFLHARMLQHWGFAKLGAHEYQESIDEMKHADALVKRVLYLGGVPNLQDIGKLMIGETVEEILQCDLKLEERAHADLAAGAKYCEEKGDYVSANLLEDILASEEDHMDYIRRQLNLIATMGLSAYLQTQV